MKTLFMIILILLLASSVQAAPFLVCDPQSGVTHYKLTGPAWVPASVPAQPDGSIRMDVATSDKGNNSLTVKACMPDPIWVEVCSDPATPFTLEKPDTGTPTNLRLIP